MIKQIGHLALTVEDMETALNFYCGVLPFEKAFELRDDDGNPWIVYVKIGNGQFLELFYGGENKAESLPKPIGFNHFCLEVDDIHEIADHVKNKGWTLDVEPQMGKDKNYQCWVKDPDGNRIEFMQLSPESPQMNS